MALNESLNFGDLEAYVQVAFQTKFAMPTKDRLPAGTVLYKFNDFNTLHGPTSNALSAWWSPYEPYKHDPGWVQKRKTAETIGVTVREWGRLTSAVKENWNSLRYLLVITLAEDVYGFFGGFASMARIDAGATSKVKQGEARGAGDKLPGGGTQFYIPNLTANHIPHGGWYVEDLV